MRIDGYAPIEDYAVIGDGRTAALVARDGVDRLAVPAELRFAERLRRHPRRRRAAAPSSCSRRFRSSRTRRYLPRTNVLETTFTTDRGSVRVVDAMTLPNDRLDPMRELVRSVEGRVGHGADALALSRRGSTTAREAPRCEWRHGIPVATLGRRSASASRAGMPARRRGATTRSKRRSNRRRRPRAARADDRVRRAAGLSRPRRLSRRGWSTRSASGSEWSARARLRRAMGRPRRCAARWR